MVYFISAKLLSWDHFILPIFLLKFLHNLYLIHFIFFDKSDGLFYHGPILYHLKYISCRIINIYNQIILNVHILHVEFYDTHIRILYHKYYKHNLNPPRPG